jgi:multidrug resistance efflux pump
MDALKKEGMPENDGSTFRADRHFSERSDLAQEIVSRKPGFVEKWAMLVFGLLLLLLIAGTWFIRYPDIIEGSAVLTSENAPKEIVPKQSGKLISLFVQNNQTVKNGEILGWLESNSSIQEVISLSEKLENAVQYLKRTDSLSIARLFNDRYSQLGGIQAPYQTFIAAWQLYNDYMINDFYRKKKSRLYDDIVSLNKIKNKTELIRGLTSMDSSLAGKTFEMNEHLYKQKVISLEDYRQAQSRLLSSQKELPQVDVNILSNQTQVREIEKEIDELDHNFLQQQIIFEQALYTLKSSVDDWLKRYTIQSPAEGKVVFMFPLQQNQYIEQGKLLGYVNPVDTKYFAEVRLSQNNFGKVDTGMKVQLRFYAYPYQETGFISGRLNYISQIAIDSGFLGTVKLDSGLVTSQHKKIQYKNGLKAQAIIITKDMRLLERLYYNLVNATTISK